MTLSPEQQQRVTEHLGLVDECLAERCRLLGIVDQLADLEDMQQEGRLALVSAVLAWDAAERTPGPGFATYARLYVHGAIWRVAATMRPEEPLPEDAAEIVAPDTEGDDLREVYLGVVATAVLRLTATRPELGRVFEAVAEDRLVMRRDCARSRAELARDLDVEPAEVTKAERALRAAVRRAIRRLGGVA